MATRSDNPMLPVEALYAHCSDVHLMEIGLKLTEWRVVAMLLGLDDTEIEDIEEKARSARERSLRMLKRWGQKFGERATYRHLASAFEKMDRTDMVEMIHSLVSVQTPTTPTTSPEHGPSSVLQTYANHLKSLYRTNRPAAIVTGLPLPSDKYFNLALIRKHKSEPPPDEPTLRSIVREGNVNRVLETKVAIGMGDLFKADGAERKIVLIEGAPGSGKSTLSRHICQKWESGEMYQEFVLVVLVQLRDLAVRDIRDIADLLPCTDDALANEVVSEIKSRRGEGVLFVMDGWDELSPGSPQETVLQQVVQPSLTNPLPKSAVIITCRSESSAQLHAVASSRIEAMGLTPSGVREFFTECLEGNSQAVETLTELVERSPEIEASCYLPLNAAILVAIFLMTPTSKLPTTLHELFTTLVLTCILHHLQTRTNIRIQSLPSLSSLPDAIQSSFDLLCQLAFNGIMVNKLSFLAEELGVESEFDTLSLLQAVQTFTFGGASVGISKTYSFLHLSIQELLAARYISLLPPNEQVTLFRELNDHPRFTTVFSFFAGMTQLRSERIAGCVLHIGKWGNGGPREHKVRLYKLKERYQYLYGTPPQSISLLTLCHMDTRILLFKCLYEAKNPSLCRAFARVTCGNVSPLLQPPALLSFLKISSDFDCLSLGYFLSWVCRTIEGETSVSIENINDSGTKFLMKGLVKGNRDAKSCEDSSIPAMAGSLCIQLYFATLSDQGTRYLAQVLQSTEADCISGLELFSCEFEEDPKYLNEALESSNSLQALCFEHHLFTVETALTLSKVLQSNSTLKKLSLSSNSLQALSFEHHLFTVETALTLSKVLQSNSTLKKLSLSSNSLQALCFEHHLFTVETALTLSKVLQSNSTLKKLSLSSNSLQALSFEHHLFTKETALTLSKVLQSNSTLKKLSLSSNSLQALCLEHHLFTVETALTLSKVLQSNSTLKKLSLSSNSLQALSFEHHLFTVETALTLSKVLQSNSTLKNLSLSSNSLQALSFEHHLFTVETALTLSKVLQSNSTLKKLSLSSNSLQALSFEHHLFTVETALTLSKVLQSNSTLKKLSLSSNSLQALSFEHHLFTVETALTLSKVLQSNSTLKKLSLSSNSLQALSFEHHLFTVETALTLSKVLQSNSTLKKLSLSSNSLQALCFEHHLFTVETALTLSKVLQSNSTLKKLSLSSNSLQALSFEHHLFTVETALTLSKVLQSNSTLKNLSLSSAPQATDTEIFTHLAEGLKCNKTIEEIKLRGFRICSDDIFHLLRCNNSLRRLDFRDFAPGDRELELLATALTINITLETLVYSEDKVPKKELPALAGRLHASGVLQQLLVISIERTVELFGERETMKALREYC